MNELGNKKVMSANIKKQMKRLGIDRNKLVGDLGLKYTTVSDWINGKTYPRIDKIEMMADYFHVEKADLVEVTPSNLERPTGIKRIPVLGTIACGNPITADENIEEYRETVADHLPTGSLFYLKAKGESMAPTIPNGSYVLVREQPSVEDGEIAAVLVNGDTEATLKRVKRQQDIVMLMPDNPGFDPIILSDDYTGRIIGKAVRSVVEL
ncbi:bifunctional S24 family peptidase / transcriptional regulator [Ligilactobacillus salitolerans]|uniref:Bifunctional S24 family peptidase / transcriptional regulator n=1 Tax=Ligilactobacillus salitolerans TaxID=1808352 RepID=A0A401ISU0_9LACO|nr:XRE family transcriptional regulator [Ligilactobacillus salitolerans]GBG94613.1 bifunctional S24 family peptidase / transcriptional regulator [Ligilactobacillus salitolerans]